MPMKSPRKFVVQRTEYPDQFDVVLEIGGKGHTRWVQRFPSEEAASEWIRTKSKTWRAKRAAIVERVHWP